MAPFTSVRAPLKRKKPNYSRSQLQAMKPAYIVAGGVKRKGKPQYGELKFLDTALTDATVAAAGAFFNLVVIPQGDTESERNGRKVTVRKLSFRARVTLPSQTAVGTTSAQYRILIVCDKQTNGAQFAATDLLETATTLSFNNLANSSRFVVLYDKIKTIYASGGVNTTAAYAFGEVQHSLKFNTMMELPLEYDNTATTGAIATCRSNSLWVLVLCTDDELLAFNGNVRIRFTDN